MKNTNTLHSQNLDKVLKYGLVFALGLFPIFKILSLCLPFFFPIHYLLIVFFTFFLSCRYLKRNRLFFFANIYLSLYYLITIFNASANLTNANYKIFLAAFTFINLAIVIYEIYKKKGFESYLKLYMNILAYVSLLLLSLITISSIILYIRYPFEWSFDNIMGLLLFSRDQVEFRSSIIIRANPVGMLLNDLGNVSYIGPQLILYPLAYTLLKITNLTKFIKQNIPKFIDIIIYISLLIYVFLLNSRAFTIILFAFGLIRFTNTTNIIHKRVATIILFLCPFSIYLLASKTISLRDCLFNFTNSNLSATGNGIGAFIDSLNSTCTGTNVNLIKYSTILTTSFDNVHLEFIHYFGYLTYLLILVMLFKNSKPSKAYFYFMSYFFIFLALNLNLFEVVLVPLTMILFISAFRSTDTSKTAVVD